MARFVSALGVDKPPASDQLDVRYLKAFPTFDAAIAAKATIDPLLPKGFTIVIYRTAYNEDAIKNQFYWARQTDLRPEGARQKNVEEPTGLVDLAYDLYAVPVSALALGQEFELNQQVRAIQEKSGTLRPGKGSP